MAKEKTGKDQKTVKEMAIEAGHSEEIAAALEAHAEGVGTTKRIQSGKCGLPDVESAKRWYERETSLKSSQQEE